jgi:hypothetical protein
MVDLLGRKGRSDGNTTPQKIDWCVGNDQIRRVARTVDELGANYPASSWHHDGITAYARAA